MSASTETSRPDDPLLDDHGRAGVAEPACLEHVARGRERLGGIRRDDDALACREPIRLDDDLAAQRVESRRRPRRRVAHTRNGAVGMPWRAKNCLENALLPSSRAPSAPGPNVGTPARAQLVGEPGDQRRLGPDDDEVDLLGDREIAQPVEIADADRHAARDLGDARVARRRDDLVPALREPPRERVLAPTTADDEDLQFLEVPKEDELVAEAVLDGHLALAPLHVLEAGPVVLVRLERRVKLLELVALDHQVHAGRAVAVVLAEVDVTVVAHDAHVERHAGLEPVLELDVEA